MGTRGIVHAQDEPVGPMFKGELPTGITVDALDKGQAVCVRARDSCLHLPRNEGPIVRELDVFYRVKPGSS